MKYAVFSAESVDNLADKIGKHDNLVDYFTCLLIRAGWRIAYSVKGTPPLGIPVHWQSNSKTIAVHTGKHGGSTLLASVHNPCTQARLLAGFLLSIFWSITTMNAQESNKKVNDSIALVAKSGKVFSMAVQAALLAIHAHKTAYGDWSGFKRLLEVMPKGARSNSVKAWIEQTTNVRFGKGKEVAMDRNAQDLPFEEAAKLNWQDADGVEKAYKGLDWNKQAEKLLDKLQSDIDHGLASLQTLESLIVGLQVGLAKKQEAAAKAMAEAGAAQVKAA